MSRNCDADLLLNLFGELVHTLGGSNLYFLSNMFLSLKSL